MKSTKLALPAVIVLALGGPALAVAQNAGNCGNAYEVRAGDTLSGIATRCGVSVEAVLNANPDLTNPASLSIGQELALPGGQGAPAAELPAAAAAAKAGQARYTVEPGDSLAGIAAALGLSLDALIAANPDTDPQALQPGQELALPVAAEAENPQPVPAAAEEEPGAARTEEPDVAEPQQAKTYTVKPGDSLGGIAASLGLSLDALMAANPTTDPRALQLGQELTLPAAETGTAGAGEEDGSAKAENEDGEAVTPSDTAEEAAPETPAEPVRLELAGRVIEGAECPVLLTADGRRYGLVSQEFGLFPGAEVTLQGEPVAMSFCQQNETLRVLSMEVAQ